MTEIQVPNIEFRDGKSIPQIGFGVFRIPDAECQAAVEAALAAGYRHIDTAAAYGNEQAVGRAIAVSGIPREELFVTTKLWNSDQGYAEALLAVEGSLARLNLDYLDLYLVHWPMPMFDLYVESWQALIYMHDHSLVRSIGVSNHNPEHLDRIVADTGLRPVINQVECHPYFAQRSLREYHRQHGIVTQAWGPIGQGKGPLVDPIIAQIAAAVAATPAQVILAWHLAHGNVVIPKSAQPERMAENLRAVNVQLSSAQISQIDGLDRGERLGSDPLTAEFGRPTRFGGNPLS